MNPVIFFTTVENKKKAQSIGNHLVKNRLAACVNIISNIESIYYWKDQLHQDSEFLLMIKSDASKKENIQKIFDNYHPYDLPELIMVTIDDGSVKYLEWMNNLFQGRRLKYLLYFGALVTIGSAGFYVIGSQENLNHFKEKI